MAGLRPLIGGISLVLLFSLALFTFMTEELVINNPNATVLNNPSINYSISALNRTISSFQDTAASSQTRLGSDEPSTTSYLFLIFKSAFYIPISFLGILINGVGVFTGVIFTQLVGPGSSPFFLAFAVFNGIMVVMVVFLIIQYIRTGQGER